MLIIGRKGAARATGLGDLAWGLPSFVTEGLNPLHHLEVMKNLVTHPVDTFKTETGKAVGNLMSVAQPWVGGPGGVKPGQSVSSFSQSGAALDLLAAVRLHRSRDQVLRRAPGLHLRQRPWPCINREKSWDRAAADRSHPGDHQRSAGDHLGVQQVSPPAAPALHTVAEVHEDLRKHPAVQRLRRSAEQKQRCTSTRGGGLRSTGVNATTAPRNARSSA